MVVAVIALIVALSGTALAASLVSGDSLIKKNSLSGNRLRNHSVSGTQISMGKLGKVPSAKRADSAKSADSAKKASSATTAGNALELGGQPAANYLTTANHIGTNGVVKASGTATGNTVPVFTAGPFTVTMTCTKTVSGTALKMFAASSEANSLLNGTAVATANTSTDTGPDISATTLANKVTDNVNIDFEAPSGAGAVLEGASGVNGLGTDCWTYWTGSR